MVNKDCKLKLDLRAAGAIEITLSWTQMSRQAAAKPVTETLTFMVNAQTLRSFKYLAHSRTLHNNSDEPMVCFVAIQVVNGFQQNVATNLARYSQCYQPSNMGVPPHHRTIALQFRRFQDWNHFRETFCSQLRTLGSHFGEMSIPEFKELVHALLHHSHSFPMKSHTAKSLVIDGRSHDSVIVKLPFVGEGQIVRSMDYETLQPNTMLNDAIIMFYLKW